MVMQQTLLNKMSKTLKTRAWFQKIKIKNRRRLDHSIQNDITKTVLVFIWLETARNKHFLNKVRKTFKKHVRGVKKIKIS